MATKTSTIFRVKVHRQDSSTESYTIQARDDVEARAEAVRLDDELYRKALELEPDDTPVPVAYCEIRVEPGLGKVHIARSRKGGAQ